MRRLFAGLASLSLVFALALPASGATQIREDAAWYRVHFGTGVGDPVPPEDVYTFIDTIVTDRFPDGLTITDTRGQWSSKEYGLTRERTFVVDIQCEDSDENFDKIREIADSYIRNFAQAKASCFVKRIPGVTTILYYQ